MKISIMGVFYIKTYYLIYNNPEIIKFYVFLYNFYPFFNKIITFSIHIFLKKLTFLFIFYRFFYDFCRLNIFYYEF